LYKTDWRCSPSPSDSSFVGCLHVWELSVAKELAVLSIKSLSVSKIIQDQPIAILPTKFHLTHLISQSIHHSWVSKWQDLDPTNKLAALRKARTPLHSSNQPSRKTEIMLTRLRIGHTRLLASTFPSLHIFWSGLSSPICVTPSTFSLLSSLPFPTNPHQSKIS